MTNKWIKRIKNDQDNFFDRNLSYEYSYNIDFDNEFIKAKNISSFPGELCKLAGGFGMFLGGNCGFLKVVCGKRRWARTAGRQGWDLLKLNLKKKIIKPSRHLGRNGSLTPSRKARRRII